MAIVRLSGTQSGAIINALIERRCQSDWRSHQMYFGRLLDAQGHLIDEVLAVFMKAPHSYTGQDCAEIHCHGGRLLPQLVLDLCVQRGARLARPGEFTLRAFLNGKMDLAQSESVLGLIEAASGGEVLLNAQGLEGALSRRVQALRGQLLDLVAQMEAEIDFGEEVEGLPASAQISRAKNIEAQLHQLLQGARGGEMLSRGVAVALVGPPNAGKSTLWNALLGEERALVTPIPGTTRDSLEATCTVGGVFLRLTDTAGLRQSGDAVELLGMERTRRYANTAQLLVLVLDGSAPLSPDALQQLADLDSNAPRLIVLNKRDLGCALSVNEALAALGCASSEALGCASPEALSCEGTEALGCASLEALGCEGTEALNGASLATQYGTALEVAKNAPFEVLEVSLLNDDDVRRVEERLGAMAAELTRGCGEGAVSVNQRQAEALERAGQCLQNYTKGVEAQMPPDCLLSDLHRALGFLGEITGASVSDDIISQVFSKFCLGK